MPLKPYAKLRGRIVEKYNSISYFADNLNMSRTMFSLKLNKKNKFSIDDISVMANMLDIPLEEYGLYFFAD